MYFQKAILIRIVFSLALVVLLLSAKGQTLNIVDRDPKFTALSGTTHQSNLEITLAATQTGNVYYVLYDEKPSTTPSKELVVDYATGATTAPVTVLKKGSFNNVPADTAAQTISALTPHINYYGYFVLKNSAGTLSAVASTKIRILAGKQKTYYYTEYVSETYQANPTTSYPLMIFLHGIEERGTSISSLGNHMKYGPPKQVSDMSDQTTNSVVKELQNFIIISPMSNVSTWDTDNLHQFINEIIGDQTLRIDTNRVYLTGLSMGGIGTWYYAQEHPYRVAAIVPISGKGIVSQADKLAKIPVWAFHDDPDPKTAVPTQGTIDMVNAIRGKAGYSGDASYTLRKQWRSNDACALAYNHSIWNVTYTTSHITPITVKNKDCVANTNDGYFYTEDHDNIGTGMTIYKWLLRYSKAQMPPLTVSAGADRFVALPSGPVQIQGTATGGTAPYTYLWTKLSGPTAGTLSNTTTSQLTVNNVAAGTYVFNFQVTDANHTIMSDQVSLTVTSEATTKIVKIDFRGSGGPVPSSNEWNDFTAFSTGSVLATTKYTDQSAATFTLTVNNGFTLTNANGTPSTSGIYPSEVMQTAWYVNSTTVGQITIGGLNNAKSYKLKFFGSRVDPNGPVNRNTDYTVTGFPTQTLDASNNTSETATVDNIIPTNGTITFTVDGGAGASSGLGYLNAMEIEEKGTTSGGGSTTKSMLVDVGSSTPTPPSGWNDFDHSGASAGGTFNDLKYSDSSPGTYDLTINTGFTNTNTHGSTSPTGVYPASVMQTAWYTVSGVTASVTVSGLNTSKKYTFRFFASRMETGTKINRTTNFQIGTVMDTVNASNNSNNVAEIVEVVPAGNGTITFTVKGGTGASSGLGYMNAFEIIEITENASFAQAATADDTQIVEVRSARKDKVSIYPSPFRQRITLAFSEALNGKLAVTVRGSTGEVFYQNSDYWVTSGSELDIDLGKAVPKGLVFVEIVSSTGYRETFKVFKE